MQGGWTLRKRFTHSAGEIAHDVLGLDSRLRGNGGVDGHGSPATQAD
jgi:hypothetical protein